ncbi:MAG: hypothetical protein K9G46_11150 [Flavobacteriales bacterium]|jgi:hypothetical protein|nr:hypothetical protein [Flavobacteriales bacterium]
MKEHDSTAFVDSGDSKGRKRQAQRRELYAYLRKHTVSRWMAAQTLNIPLQSVCWAVGQFCKADAVAVVRKGKCAVSGEWVEYTTTDPEKFPKSNQQKIFSDEQG